MICRLQQCGECSAGTPWSKRTSLQQTKCHWKISTPEGLLKSAPDKVDDKPCPTVATVEAHKMYVMSIRKEKVLSTNRRITPSTSTTITFTTSRLPPSLQARSQGGCKWVQLHTHPPPPPPRKSTRSVMNFVTSMFILLTIYTYSDNCQLSGNSSVVLSIVHFRLTCTLSKMGQHERERQRKRAAANCCSREQFLPQRTKQKVGMATSQQQEQLHGTSELKLATCSTSLVATVQPFTDGEPPSQNIVQQQLIIEPPSPNIIQQQLIIEPPSPNIIQQQLIIEPPSPNIIQQQLIITTANTQPTCIATDTEQPGTADFQLSAEPSPSSRHCAECNTVSEEIELHPTDIGEIYYASKSSHDFCVALKSLSTAERYALLKHHKQPSLSYIYPVTLMFASFPKMNGMESLMITVLKNVFNHLTQ